MPMLVRCRGLLNVVQRAVVLSNQSPVSLRWMQTGPSRSLSSTGVTALGSNVSTSTRFHSGSNRFYSVVATPNVVEDEAAEVKTNRENHATSNALEKLLHGISINVQRTGRVLSSEIRNAEHLIQLQGGCSSNQALLLLRCCGSVCVDERNDDRTKLVERIWNLLEKSGVVVDESHYNALLRSHIENEHDFSPSEFLSWMENTRGVTPNRVTYQHLVARYCSMGDIAGATTILEFMKQKDMTVNENVFHSLITGHCRNGDFASAEGIMNIMAESGIDVGAEAHICLLLGMVKSGKSFEEIEAKIAKASEANVVFSDHEIFRLVVEFVRAGNKEAATKASESLPKTRGFFQEMRNAIPQMIHAGEIDLPFAILANFKAPTLGDQTHTDAATRDHGLFMLRAMVKNEYPIDKVFAFFEKLNVNLDTSAKVYVPRLLEVCVEYGKTEYGRKFADQAREKFGEEVIRADYFSGYIRSMARWLTTKEEVINYIVTLDSIGIPFNYTNMSNDLMPKLFSDLEHTEPARIITSITDQLSNNDPRRQRLNWSFMVNAAVQHFLNREDSEGLFTVARMIANINIQPRPAVWNASLARSYLATDKLDWMVTILYSCSAQVQAIVRDREIDYDKDVDLFSSLVHLHSLAPRYRPDQSADDVVLEVLRELKRIRLGIPEETSALLKPAMDESAHELLDDLVLLHKDRKIHLTRDRVESQINSSKSKLRVERKDSSHSWHSTENDLPEDVASLEAMKKSFEVRGANNNRVTAALIEAYAKKRDFAKIDSLLQEIQLKGQNFSISATTIDTIVADFIKDQNLDEALTLLQPESESTSSALHEHFPDRLFLNTFAMLGKALAAAGRHEDVLNMLQKIDPAQINIGNMVTNVTVTMDYYADDLKDPDRVEAVYKVLKEKGFIEKSAHMSPLVNAFLNKDDIEGAVAKFEALAKEEKRLTQKFKLMEKLIQLEDMERMQRVLDASIGCIGEEKSLYDLATSFLYLGKTSQARKLLETPGLRYNPDKVNHICNFFEDKGMITALENFVHLTQPVFACDREFLYSKLINVYKSDSSKMTELWVRMQEEGYVPSDAVKSKMAEAFQQEGKPAPFQVPIQAERSPAETRTEAGQQSKPKTERAKEQKGTKRMEELQLQKEKKSKQRATKEKTEGQLAHERLIDEELSTFSKAVETNDVATAFEEMSKYIVSDKYIPNIKIKIALEFFEKNQAWEEASKTIALLLRRKLEGQVLSAFKCVGNVLDHSKPEVVKELAELMNPESKKRLKIASRLQK